MPGFEASSPQLCCCSFFNEVAEMPLVQQCLGWLWKSLSSKGCVCKGGKTSWKHPSSGSGAGLLHAEPEMRPDLCSLGEEQTCGAWVLSLSECTCGLPPWLSRHVASAQLFEGLSPKIFQEEVNDEKKTILKKKKEGRSPVAAGSERLLLEWTLSKWLFFTSQGRNMKNMKYVAGLDEKENVIRVGQRMSHAPTASELGSRSPGKPM